MISNQYLKPNSLLSTLPLYAFIETSVKVIKYKNLSIQCMNIELQCLIKFSSRLCTRVVTYNYLKHIHLYL